MKRSPLFVVCLIALVDLSSFGLIIPLLPIYAKRFGADAKLLGLLLGSYSLAQFVCAPILGKWSDRIGRRPVLLVSVGGSVASCILLGVADLCSWMWLLFVARMLDGMTGGNIATAQAYVADVTSGKDRARGMGLIGAMIGLGFVIGPALGFALLSIGTRVTNESGTSWPAFGAAVISSVSLFLVWRYLPEPQTHCETAASAPQSRSFFGHLGHVAGHPRLRELLVLLAMVTFCFVVFETTLVYTCMQRFQISKHNVMFVFVYIGLLIVVVRGGLVGRLASRFGEPNLLIVGPLLSACGFFIIALSQYWPHIVMILGACLPIAVGAGVGDPVIRAMLSRQAAAAEQGLTMGVASGLGSLMRAVVPVLAGALYDISVSLPYWIAATVYVFGGIFALTIKKAQKQSLLDPLPPARVLSAQQPSTAE